ncbi:hypothetical protein ACIP5Y_21765 [Nocardia sp. NPDC088792]|uniref:hypothetical protein n=1 Tax=Nocardia sp. NPDC088792 TaxID=3364332 RepID=UPI00381A3FE5
MSNDPSSLKDFAERWLASKSPSRMAPSLNMGFLQDIPISEIYAADLEVWFEMLEEELAQRKRPRRER